MRISWLFSILIPTVAIAACGDGVTVAPGTTPTDADASSDGSPTKTNTDGGTSIADASTPDTSPAVDAGTCATAGCSADATCAQGPAGPVCTCKTGFSGDGKTCTNIDDCASNPCQNGGTCVDAVNDFTCTCPAGYDGKTCNNNVDDCSPNPCVNGGTCVDGANDFTCTCPAGYDGKTCSNNIDECAANPCQNGGTCTDGVNSFTCSCAAGYTGATCTTVATSCLAIKTALPASTDGVYMIDPDGPGGNAPHASYCDMTTGGGGWTLAMKGAAAGGSFPYAAGYWTDTQVLNETSTNLTVEDAKFAAFHEVTGTSIRLDTTNAVGSGSITLPTPTPDVTLRSIFQGTYTASTAGRAAWMNSQAGTILQNNCNREGFNVQGSYVSARIGMETNQENNCGSSDSVVGVGTGPSVVCGNTGTFSAGFYSGPSCTPHSDSTGAAATPSVPARAADFFVWIR